MAIVVELEAAEVELIIAALRSYPDPEAFDFAPAFESEKQKADKLRAEFEAALLAVPE